MDSEGERVRELLRARNTVRPAYDSERQFFKENPVVAGYAADDGRVVLRPDIPPNHAPIVHALEGARLEMRRRGDQFSAPLTEGQMSKLREWNATAYLNDPAAARQSVVSRIVSGDPSLAPYTQRQQQESQWFADSVAGDEEVFRRWYAAWAKRTGMDPDPDHPEHRYDYRAAYVAGSQPDADMHWPSEFKHDDHANRFIEGVDTKTGKKAQRGL